MCGGKEDWMTGEREKERTRELKMLVDDDGFPRNDNNQHRHHQRRRHHHLFVAIRNTSLTDVLVSLFFIWQENYGAKRLADRSDRRSLVLPTLKTNLCLIIKSESWRANSFAFIVVTTIIDTDISKPPPPLCPRVPSALVISRYWARERRALDMFKFIEIMNISLAERAFFSRIRKACNEYVKQLISRSPFTFALYGPRKSVILIRYCGKHYTTPWLLLTLWLWDISIKYQVQKNPCPRGCVPKLWHVSPSDRWASYEKKQPIDDHNLEYHRFKSTSESEVPKSRIKVWLTLDTRSSSAWIDCFELRQAYHHRSLQRRGETIEFRSKKSEIKTNVCIIKWCRFESTQNKQSRANPPRRLIAQDNRCKWCSNLDQVKYRFETNRLQCACGE